MVALRGLLARHAVGPAALDDDAPPPPHPQQPQPGEAPALDVPGRVARVGVTGAAAAGVAGGVGCGGGGPITLSCAWSQSIWAWRKAEGDGSWPAVVCSPGGMTTGGEKGGGMRHPIPIPPPIIGLIIGDIIGFIIAGDPNGIAPIPIPIPPIPIPPPIIGDPKPPIGIPPNGDATLANGLPSIGAPIIGDPIPARLAASGTGPDHGVAGAIVGGEPTAPANGVPAKGVAGMPAAAAPG